MNQMRNLFTGGTSGIASGASFGGSGMGSGNMGGPFGNMMNMIGQFRNFMQNPISAMMGNGINIPQNIQNNPEAIINYMRSSGQMSDDQYNQVSQMAQMAQGFFGNGK